MTNHIQIEGITPRIQYVANGILTTYSFPFAIFKATDIKVYLGDSLQSSSTYTVSINSETHKGNVIFNTAPADETKITILRDLSIERTSDFQEGATLRADVLNDELDYQIACQQQITDNLNRSMVLPPYAVDSNLDLTLPTPEAGKAIVWNSAGTNLENSTVSVNALESTLNGYKTAAQAAASTATTKAENASQAATTATAQAEIATTKAAEATSASSNKAEKDFSNVTETNAHKLIGNRIWISEDYDLSTSANVVISHNLGLTDTTKALAIPYLKFTSSASGYEVGDIISAFSLAGNYYSPGGNLAASAGYGCFLNLSENNVVVPKILSDQAIVIYNKSTGAITLLNKSNVKLFVKIIY